VNTFNKQLNIHIYCWTTYEPSNCNKYKQSVRVISASVSGDSNCFKNVVETFNCQLCHTQVDLPVYIRVFRDVTEEFCSWLGFLLEIFVQLFCALVGSWTEMCVYIIALRAGWRSVHGVCSIYNNANAARQKGCCSLWDHCHDTL